VKVDASNKDVDWEDLLWRFKCQVSHVGVTEEIRRWRRHEDARDTRKHKA
jgi:ribosomal protein S21